MNEDREAAVGGGTIMLHLIDPARGARLHSWEFTAEPVIRIGRSENNHVVIHDQHVSRVHAEINYESGEWILVDLGHQGTLLNGEPVYRAPLADSMRFRLGRAGPALQFLEQLPSAGN